MNQAEYIIGIIGGIRPAARILGCHPSTVSYWRRTGRIPSQYHVDIINKLRYYGVDVDLEKFCGLN